MKRIFLFLSIIVSFSFNTWQADFEQARATATTRHQLLLLNFSGSDWCGPCIRMHKEVFNDKVFSTMADTSLVLYNADFPRNKKNQLDKAVKLQNEKLADRYNPEGKFPFTVLLDSNGRVVQSWDGFPAGAATQFTEQVKKSCNAYH